MQRTTSYVGFASLLNPDDESNMSLGRMTVNNTEDTSLERDSRATTTPSLVGSPNSLSESGVDAKQSRPGSVEAFPGAHPIKPNGSGPISSSSASNSPEPTELPRPYKCPLCDKAFHRLEHQTRHIRTHTGEKPHACQFPGCSKKFSRSDELTRHSRIHNNSTNGNKKRNLEQAQAQAQDKSTNLPLPHAYTISINDSMPPPPPSTTRFNSRHHVFTSAPLQNRENLARPHPPYYPQHHHNHHHVNYQQQQQQQQQQHPFAQRPPSLSAYRTSTGDDPILSYHHQQPQQHYRSLPPSKRSRPNSPNSTAPSSPSTSHTSLSPTPDHTPLTTPAISPRLMPMHQDLKFPHLSLNHHQLPQLEPPPDMTLLPPPLPYQQKQLLQQKPRSEPRTSGMSLSDIVHSTNASERQLPPLEKVSISSILSGGSAIGGSSGRGPYAGPSTSVAVGGDLVDRV